MKKTNFVHYYVTMEKKVKKGNTEERVPVVLEGIMEDSKYNLGKVFQRHPEALYCISVVEEIYTPIYI